MPFEDHRTCAGIAPPEQGRAPTVLATFQPQRRQIIIVVGGGNPAGVALDLGEARSIHAAIGQALKLADAVEWPLEVVK